MDLYEYQKVIYLKFPLSLFDLSQIYNIVKHVVLSYSL